MSNHRHIIDGNLVTLCNFTQCNEILIDTCIERNIITLEDRHEIEKEKTLYTRNRIFYGIMRRKDEAMYQKLVEIMKEESTAQSGDVLKILVGNQSEPSSQKRPRLQNLREPEEKSIWFNVQDPITSFVGRENELKELHEIVTRNADKDTQVSVMSQLTSVSRMGGIGKTTLAREYAKRYAPFYNNNIIWINADTPSSTEESFRKLADGIGIRNMLMGKQNEKVVPISKVITDTYGYFSKRKCLFVFDNVDEYKSTVAPFIPHSYDPGKIRPFILMTSRKQQLVDCKVLCLNILTIIEAEKLIKSKLQKWMGQIDDKSVRILAEVLQCLPLALQLAVAYIRNQVHLSSLFSRKQINYIDEYLKLLEENTKGPFRHNYKGEIMDDYAYTVMKTCGVTLKTIEGEEYGTQAIEILEMMSYFRPENININLFNIVFSDEEIHQSCVILDRYSLVNLAGKYISIHRLVQQVIRVRNMENDREEYLLEQCLSFAAQYTKRYDNNYIYWKIWKHSLCYENLVIKYRSILGRIFEFTNMKDLEILNLSLEILEKKVKLHELMDLYLMFIDSALDEPEMLSGIIPDWLARNGMIRLNAIIELGTYDSICKILSSASSWIGLYSATRIPKFVRDVVQVISYYCYEHSAEVVSRHDSTPYLLVEFWLNFKELGQCRLCFRLLVLGTGTESVKNTVIIKLDNAVLKNFHLFNKYLMQLVTAQDKDEREFVTKVLDYCRSLPLEADEIGRLEKVDILLCNILCMIILNYSCIREVRSCVVKMSVQMRNELTDFQEIKAEREFWLYTQHRLRFERTMEDITSALNNVVIIGTTPLVSSEWSQYVEKVIKFIGIYEEIMRVELHTEESRTSGLPELESTISGLVDLGDLDKSSLVNLLPKTASM